MAKKTEQSAKVDQAPASPPRSITDLVIDVGRQWAIFIGAVVGLGYLYGYIIVNWYMSYIGVRPPNLITSRYLSTGILYLVCTALPLALFFLITGPSGGNPNNPRRLIQLVGKLGLGIAGILVALLLIGLIASLLSRNPHNKPDDTFTKEFWFIMFGLAGNMIIWLLAIGVLPGSLSAIFGSNEDATRQSILRFEYSSFALRAIFAVILGLIFFVALVYPNTNSAFGGGAAIPVQLFLDSDSLVAHNLPMSSQAGMTDAVSLLDQSDDGYIVLLPDKTIVIVPKDQVRGVLIKPHQ